MTGGSIDLKYWIRDPVHGHIRLTEVEREVIDTPVFQRLRRVKQLGLASTAFPSADYPRFEHSLGVMEVTGRVFERINGRRGKSYVPRCIQEMRLAALLHDIGHYPFSHTMEDALKRVYESKPQSNTGGAMANSPSGATLSDKIKTNSETMMMHEEVGSTLLERDRRLSQILSRHGVDAAEVGRIFAASQSKIHISQTL